MKNPFSDPKHPIDYGLFGKDVKVKGKSVSSPEFIIDPDWAKEGKFLSQNFWIAHWKETKKQMFDCSHFYKLPDDIVKSIHEDVKKYWANVNFKDDKIAYPVSLGSAIHYHGNGGFAMVEHHVTNPDAKLHPGANVGIEEFMTTPLPAVLDDSLGLHFMHILFDNDDNPKKLTDRLVYLTGKEPKDILLNTKPIRERNENDYGAVVFLYGNPSTKSPFIIDCRAHHTSFESEGKSRGVLLK